MKKVILLIFVFLISQSFLSAKKLTVGNNLWFTNGTITTEMNYSGNTSTDTSLVLYLSADSGLVDLSGNNNTITNYNVTISQTPWGSSTFNFNGLNGYLEIPDVNNIFDFIGDFTIEFISKPTEMKSGVLISKGGFDNYPKNLSIGWGSVQPQTGYWWGVGGGTAQLSNLFFDQWKKITFIAKGDSIIILENGQVSSRGLDPNFQQNLANEINDQPLRIGEGFSTAPGQWGAQYFSGLIDEIKIYNRALDISEIDTTTSFINTPKDLSIRQGFNNVTLTWQPNTENNVAKYRIYRSTNSPALTLFDSVSVSKTFYTDRSLSNGQIYYYRITAVNNNNLQGDFSNEVSILFTSADTSLVLYLSANNGFIDLSGKNNVINKNNVTISQTPWGGSAYNFNGSNYLEIPDVNNILDFIGDFTIEFILNQTINNTSVLLSKSGFDYYPRNFVLGNWGGSDYYWYGVGGGTASLTNLTINTWKKITFIGKSDSIIVLENGQVTNRFYDPNFQQNLSNEINDEPLRIGEGFSTGNNSDWGAHYFTGLVEEVKIYNRALDISEINGFNYVDTTQTSNIILLNPTQNQGQINPLTQFSWQPYTGAVNYTLEINNGPDFTNPQYSYTTSSTTFTVPQMLNENSQYWWRVKADNSQWSDVWQFDVSGSNNSILFDGVGSRIRTYDGNQIIPNAVQSAYMINGKSITVEAWVYPLGFPNSQSDYTIVSRPLNYPLADPWNSYSLSVHQENGFAQPAFSISAGTPGSQVVVLSPDVLPTFQWTHIAGTYDGNTVKIYVNGVLKGEINTNISIASNNGVGFYIGRYLSTPFQGAIDDIRIWNITRTQSEIQSNMTNELLGSESGLAGYWKMNSLNQVKGINLMKDQTVNHNDLEVQGQTTIIPFNPSETYGNPTFTVSPSSVNFGNVEQGSASPPQSITLINTSTNPLIGKIDKVTSNISMASGAVFFIDPGQTKQQTISVIPISKGQINESLIIQSNASSSSLITITGSSIPLGLFDANNISMWTQRNGVFAYSPFVTTGGLEWPKGSGKTTVYSSGIWIGANVGGSVRTAASIYKSEFAPGPIVDGVAANPNDFTYRVYKIQKGDSASTNPDYASWPSNLGAPTNPDGSPQIIGDQTLFSVYNDLNPGNHYLGSQPLGVEVQQTIFGFNQSDVLGNTVFLRFKIINKSNTTWNDAYIALWNDPDLGDPTDDLIGVDTARNLGFVYNGSNNDQMYGPSPPALGYEMLKGAYFTKPIQGFAYFTNGGPLPQNDPYTFSQAYNFMKGFRSDGSAYIDPTTNLPTKYALNGDPVNNQGWIDSPPADKRFLLTTGPLNIEPGQSKEIIAAIILGQGTDNINSIKVLRSGADIIKELFNSGQIFGGAVENVTTATIPEGETITINDLDNSGAQITLSGGTGGATVEVASYVGPPPGAQTITTSSIVGVGKYVEIYVQGTVSMPIPIRIYYTINDLLQAGIVESDIIGIDYWQDLTNNWNLYSNSGIDDQGRGPSTTWVDTSNIIIDGVNYEGFTAANAFHLTKMVIAARNKSIQFEFNQAKTGLTNLLASTTGKTQKNVSKALDSFIKSQDKKYWVDDSHLSKKGEKVFKNTKKSIKKLMKIKKSIAGIQPIIDHIYNADLNIVNHLLLEITYKYNQKDFENNTNDKDDDKKNKGGNKIKKGLDKAINKIVKAKEKYSKGDFDKAVEDLKKSWQNLMDLNKVELSKLGNSDMFETLPTEFALMQNYPNPFNPISTIKYDLPKDVLVSIKLYDILGRQVKTLVNEYKSAGRYSYKLDASNLSSGIYFYRINAGDFSQVKKMVLLK